MYGGFGCCKLISSSSPEEYWRGCLPFPFPLPFLFSSRSAFFFSCFFSFSIFLRCLSSFCCYFFFDASFSFLSFSLMISTYSFDVSTQTPVMRREGCLSLSSAWGIRNNYVGQILVYKPSPNYRILNLGSAARSRVGLIPRASRTSC